MSYPVGTICIGQKFTVNTERNGMECVVIEDPQLLRWEGTDGTTGVDILYKVEWADGEIAASDHRHLKRKSDYDEEKRAEDRTKVRNLYDALEKAAESAIEAGEKV